MFWNRIHFELQLVELSWVLQVEYFQEPTHTQNTTGSAFWVTREMRVQPGTPGRTSASTTSATPPHYPLGTATSASGATPRPAARPSPWSTWSCASTPLAHPPSPPGSQTSPAVDSCKKMFIKKKIENFFELRLLSFPHFINIVYA